VRPLPRSFTIIAALAFWTFCSPSVAEAAALDGRPRIARTPEIAATNSVGGKAIQTNLAGRYALVVVRGGHFEDSVGDLVILTKHFSFGWQSIADVYTNCDVVEMIASESERLDLLHNVHGIHTTKGPCPAAGSVVDDGPRADVEAIRASDPAAFVETVRVAQAYALAALPDAQHLYRREADRWVRIAGGGGSLAGEDLKQYGVPRSDWCTLLPYDAGCQSR
jgi:hypothetical protein